MTIQNLKNTFSKIKFYLLEKKGSQQKESKKTKWTFQYEGFFWFEKVEKHETGDAKGDKKKKKRKTKKNGTRWKM